MCVSYIEKKSWKNLKRREKRLTSFLWDKERWIASHSFYFEKDFFKDRLCIQKIIKKALLCHCFSNMENVLHVFFFFFIISVIQILISFLFSFGKFTLRPLGNFVVSTFVAQPLYIEPSAYLSVLDVSDCRPTRAILFTNEHSPSSDALKR